MRSWPPKPTSRGSGTVWSQGCTRVKLYQFFSILVTCDLTLLIFVDWMQSNCSIQCFGQLFVLICHVNGRVKAAFDVFFFWIMCQTSWKLSIFDALSCPNKQTKPCGFVNRTLIGHENWKKPKYLQSVKQGTSYVLVHWWVNYSTLLRVFEFYLRKSLQQKNMWIYGC